MTDRPIIETLNDLLSLERSSLIGHLPASTTFVSWATAQEEPMLRGMVREISEHERWLVETIVKLKGGVAPPRPDPRTAELNYQELRHILPMVIRNEQRIIEQFERSLPTLARHPEAASVASKILGRHREHVQKLKTYLAATAPVAT